MIHFSVARFLAVAACAFFGGTAIAGFAEKQGPVAVLYVYPSDADANGVYTLEELIGHFDGPIQSFWREQSYGRYDPEVDIFVWRLPVDTATVTGSSERYVPAMLADVLPDNGYIDIPAYDPNQYAFTAILLGAVDGGFAGGFGGYTLNVNGVVDSLGIAGMTYEYPGTVFYSPHVLFNYYGPPDQPPFDAFDDVPIGGHHGGERSFYPELGIIGPDQTLLHEWGHALGLTSHANFWRSETEPLYGGIYWNRRRESLWDQQYNYGNLFDIMGGNTGYALHINAFYKELLGWFLESEKVRLDSTRRNIRLHPYQSQQAGEAKTAFYPVPQGQFSRPLPFDSTLDYALYLEYRRPMGFDAHLGHPYMQANTEGLMICMTRRNERNEFLMSWLLDMSPDTVVHDPSPTLITDGSFNEDDHHETTLNRGYSFYDAEMAITITNIRPDGDAGLDFDFETGPKPGMDSGVFRSGLYSGETQSTSDGVLLYSPRLRHRMELDASGELVTRRLSDDGVIWSGSAAGIPIDILADGIALVDGDLQLLDADRVIWNSGTQGHPESRLTITALGELRVVDTNDELIWPTNGPVLSTIGGTVTGLAGPGLVLRNNQADDLVIDADGAFEFSMTQRLGSRYSVTVASSPREPFQACTVSNGTGNIGALDATDIAINCETLPIEVFGDAFESL